MVPTLRARAVLVQSANGLGVADADDPQARQRGRGHLDAHALAGTQEAQATGIENVAVKGNLAAVIKQHAARAALIVVSVNTCLHGVRLPPGLVQHSRGMPPDPHGQCLSQRLVIINIGAQSRHVQVQPHVVAPVLVSGMGAKPRHKIAWGQRAEQHRPGA